MNARTIGWTIVMAIAGAFLVYRAAFTEHGMGRIYVKPVVTAPQGDRPVTTRWVEARPLDAQAVVSLPRSIGLWLAALSTLAILSFLYRDNVIYKFAEAVFVGVSAGWAMVVGFWDGIVDKLLARLAPDLMREWALPELSEKAHPGPDWLYLVPLALGVMLLWRLVPRGAWVARWPLALIVGSFAGLKLVNFLDADFVNQIRNTIIPFVVVTDGGVKFWASLRNVGVVAGVLSCLTYFFFSVEHRGVVGSVARVGIWFLMVTFGASFAFTVMGRIALLAARIEFLFDDWLWVIDPTGRRPSGW
ncbi:MAG: hypothetical protein ACT4QC_05640 [Planctomycetaceae bacterium]